MQIKKLKPFALTTKNQWEVKIAGRTFSVLEDVDNSIRLAEVKILSGSKTFSGKKQECLYPIPLEVDINSFEDMIKEIKLIVCGKGTYTYEREL